MYDSVGLEERSDGEKLLDDIRKWNIVESRMALWLLSASSAGTVFIPRRFPTTLEGKVVADTSIPS